MKSNMKIKSPVIWDKEVIISDIRCDLAEAHFQRMKEMLKEENDDLIRARVNAMIVEDAQYNAAMQYISSFFDFTIDQADVDANIASFGKVDEQQKKLVNALANNKVKQVLLNNFLANELKVDVTENEINAAIARAKNYGNVQAEHDKDVVKNAILDQKIVTVLLNKFKFVLATRKH